MNNIKIFIITLCMLLLTNNVISQTKKEVLIELEKQNILYPKIVLAQAILETGWFKCDKCSMSKNNLFGLWDNKNKRYFPYNTWQESIGGYKRGIEYKFTKKEYRDYYEFLEDIGYASDPEYINKIKIIVDKL